MVAALFLSNYTEGPLKQRFDSGKEVLTALIAILATVVGFYFGSEGSDTSERGEAEAIALQPISVSNPQPRPEETVQITTLASGGEAPYRYTIDFQWGAADSALELELPDITRESVSGLIAEKVVISKALAGKSIPYALTVTDARNRAYHTNGEKLVVAAAPTTPDRAATAAPAPPAKQ